MPLSKKVIKQITDKLPASDIEIARIITNDLLTLEKEKAEIHFFTVRFLYNWTHFSELPTMYEIIWSLIIKDTNRAPVPCDLYRCTDQSYNGMFVSFTKRKDALEKIRKKRPDDRFTVGCAAQDKTVMYYPLCDAIKNIENTDCLSEELKIMAEEEAEYVVFENSAVYIIQMEENT